jgi:hypothetical protein
MKSVEGREGIEMVEKVETELPAMVGVLRPERWRDAEIALGRVMVAYERIECEFEFE